MSEDLVNIEVNGVAAEGPQGSDIMQVTGSCRYLYFRDSVITTS